MIPLLAQGDPGASGGGALAAYVALGVSVLTPLVALINAWSQRRSRHERLGAAKKTHAEGDAIATGTPLEWRTTDHQALLDERSYSKLTRAQLNEAEERVRNLRDRVAEQDRKIDELTAHLVSVSEDLRQLRVSIAACPGGPICPLHPIVPRKPDPTEPPGEQ